MDVIVHRWLNSNTKKTYIFTKDVHKDLNNRKDNEIDICIFKDDTILKAINKIAIGIQSLDSSISLTTIPFIWWKKRITET